MKTIDQELRLSVAATVRAELARRGLNQWDLAERMGISRGAVSQRLLGHVPFDTDDLAAVAELLDITPSEILETAWTAVRGTPCFSDCDESDELGSRLRHPTGLTSLEAEIERIGSEEREEAMSNPTVAA